jgi:hypothetical protein
VPGRKEFRLGLQPVFQVPADGPARGLPKLVSPLSDLIAVDFVPVLALIFFICRRVHVHNFVALPNR